VSASARVLTADDSTDIDARTWFARARAGDVVHLRGALADSGALDSLRLLYLDGIRELIGADRAASVRAAGLESLHHHLSVAEIARLIESLDPLGRAHVREVVGSALSVGATMPARYYVCDRLWVRAHPPVDLVEAAPIGDTPHLVGHVKPVGPHRDVALTHPRGVLSVWCAIGRVQAGNSVQLFPDDPDGEPIVPALDPGDIVVFDADRLHASCPNVTDETRIAVTARIAFPPLRYGPGNHWYPYHDSRLLGHRWSSTQSHFSTAYVRRRWANAARNVRRRLAASR